MWVQGELFGSTTVVREWGRAGSPGRVRVDHYPDVQEALRQLHKLTKAKRRRGYVS